MRNSTKLKRLIQKHDLVIKKNGNQMDLIVINNEREESFLVTGSSMSQVLDKSLKVIRSSKNKHHIKNNHYAKFQSKN